MNRRLIPARLSLDDKPLSRSVPPALVALQLSKATAERRAA